MTKSCHFTYSPNFHLKERSLESCSDWRFIYNLHGSTAFSEVRGGDGLKIHLFQYLNSEMPFDKDILTLSKAGVLELLLQSWERTILALCSGSASEGIEILRIV